MNEQVEKVEIQTNRSVHIVGLVALNDGTCVVKDEHGKQQDSCRADRETKTGDFHAKKSCDPHRDDAAN